MPSSSEKLVNNMIKNFNKKNTPDRKDRLGMWGALATDLELALVSFLYFNPDKVFHYLTIVEPEHFRSERYRKVYELIKKSQVDKVDLLSLFKQDPNILMTEILEGFSTSREADSIAHQIRQLWRTRQLYALMEDSLFTMEHDHLPDFVSSFHDKFLNLTRDREQEKSDARSILNEFERLQVVYSDKAMNGNTLIGFSCGFKDLDYFIDGFRPGHLWTIGGYTSTGKTFFSLNMVAAAIEQGRRVVYYSLEMSQVDIMSRLLGIMCRVSGIRIMKGRCSNEEVEAVAQAKKKIEASGFVIHSDIRDNESLKLSMLEETLRRPVDLFMLDYIQLVSVKDQDDLYNTMRIAATDMQTQAKVLKVPVLLLSQVSNEAVRSRDTQVIGMKGAGDIAAVSDIAAEIILAEDNKEIYQTKLKNKEPIRMKLAVKKNRHGDIGDVEYQFDKRTGRFDRDDFDEN